MTKMDNCIEVAISYFHLEGQLRKSSQQLTKYILVVGTPDFLKKALAKCPNFIGYHL